MNEGACVKLCRFFHVIERKVRSDRSKIQFFYCIAFALEKLIDKNPHLFIANKIK